MQILKWVAIAIVAWFVWSWLRNGIQGGAYLGPNAPGASNGGLYGPSSAWMGSFGYVPVWRQPRVPSYVSYDSSSGDINAQFGF